MSINDAESSTYGGAPIQLFLFAMGAVQNGYVSGTSHPYNWNNLDFVPDAAIALGEINQALSESSPVVDITITATSEVAMRFVPFLPPEPIQVRVYRAHPTMAPGEYAPEFIGEVIASRFDMNTGVCTLSARMLAADMARSIPWCVYSTNCNRTLYGAGCEVDRESYVTDTTVSSGAGLTVLSASAFASAALDHGAAPEMVDDWFRNGFVRHVETNEVRTVIGHDGTDLHLHTPFTKLRNGDRVLAYAGCSRDRKQCRVKFNNLHRFLGFPWPPNRNPYTQTVYGTGAASAADLQALRDQAGAFNFLSKK